MDIFRIESKSGRLCFLFISIIGVISLNQLFYSNIATRNIQYFLFAPVIEETFRAFSVLTGFSLLYTLILSVIEFGLYVGKYFTHGMATVNFILARIICIVMHFIFLGIQLHMFHLAKKYNKSWVFIVGILIAITIHFSWNTGFSSVVTNLIFGEGGIFVNN